MSNPVDIKIAHINNQEDLKGSLDKDKVFEVFQRNINEVLKGLYRLQQEWVNRSYLNFNDFDTCLLYTSPSPRDATLSRMPSSA